MEAEDNGRPLQKRNQARLLITVVEPIPPSPSTPIFLDAWDTVVEENMQVGQFVASVFAVDNDDDPLWYTITGELRKEDYAIYR